MTAAALTQITHVQHELAVAANTTAFQPGLFEQAQQALVVVGLISLGLLPPGAVAAGMHYHDFAEEPHAMLLILPLDERDFPWTACPSTLWPFLVCGATRSPA